MAAEGQSAHTGRDLASMAEARAWTRPARLEAELAAFSQEHVDNQRGIFGI